QRDLVQARLETSRRVQLAFSARHAGQQLDSVHGQPDRATLVGQRAGHRLPNPPVDVGAEAEAAAPVVFVNADLQADVAFLDQVQEAQATVQIPAGDRDNQPQIAFDQVAASALTVFDELLQTGGFDVAQQL